MKEESFFQYDFQSLNLDSFYSPHTFHLKNVSSDSHPILRSIRILPRFNPHICYPCLLAVFFSTNLLLAKDVSSFLSRAKELLRSLHLASLSYYTTAQQRCFDDTLICGVIDKIRYYLLERPLFRLLDPALQKLQEKVFPSEEKKENLLQIMH